jgi:acyl dehydratase
MQDNYNVGDSYSIKKSFTSADVKFFSELSLDKNPVHLDESFAKHSIFKKPIVHGILVSGLISSVIANYLPGPGSIYLGQTLNFKSPVFHNEEVEAIVEIEKIRVDKNIFYLNTFVKKSDESIAIEGKAVVKLIKNDI